MSKPSGNPGQSPQHYYNDALSATKVTVLAARCNVYGFYFENNNSTSDVFIQIFDKAAGSVTVGSTAPDYTFKVPAGGALGKDSEEFPMHHHGTGFVIACTATRTGSGSPASNATVQFWYAPHSS